MESQRVEIPTPDGRMPARLVEPEGAGPFPAVVVLMEAFGLVPHVEAVAERLAGEGYVALAPDLYYRAGPDSRVGYDQLADAIALMQKLDDARFVEDMRASLDFLAARATVREDRIGVTGFCMGGRLAFLSACALPGRVTAAAPFYGGGIVGHLDRASDIRCPLLLFFGGRDAFIPMEQVRAIEARLSELGKEHALELYPAAEHGFFCDERASHHPEAAADAWRKLTAFFRRHLA
jgi:carboxymethylenebutenolidase